MKLSSMNLVLESWTCTVRMDMVLPQHVVIHPNDELCLNIRHSNCSFLQSFVLLRKHQQDPELSFSFLWLFQPKMFNVAAYSSKKQIPWGFLFLCNTEDANNFSITIILRVACFGSCSFFHVCTSMVHFVAEHFIAHPCKPPAIWLARSLTGIVLANVMMMIGWAVQKLLEMVEFALTLGIMRSAVMKSTVGRSEMDLQNTGLVTCGF